MTTVNSEGEATKTSGVVRVSAAVVLSRMRLTLHKDSTAKVNLLPAQAMKTGGASFPPPPKERRRGSSVEREGREPEFQTLLQITPASPQVIKLDGEPMCQEP